MTISSGDVLRIATTGGGPQSTLWQNVFHYIVTTGTDLDTQTALDDIADNIELAWATVEALISDAWSNDILEGWVYNFATHKWNGVGTSVLTALDGASVADGIPHGVAAIGRFVTDVARRQGRTFLPGFLETTIDDGIFDAALVVAMGNYMDIFTDVIITGAGSLKLCTFNTDETSVYYEDHAGYDGTFLVNAIPGYQRRRKPLVGM